MYRDLFGPVFARNAKAHGVLEGILTTDGNNAAGEGIVKA